MKIYLSIRDVLGLVVVGISLSSNLLAGNGSGYGGGETESIKHARENLVHALRAIQQKEEPDSFAEYHGCRNANEPNLCNRINSLSDAQREFLRTQIRKVADQIIKLNVSSQPTPITLTPDALEGVGPTGAKLALGAKTEYGPQGPIIINSETVRTLSPLGLIALVTHEFGHKVKFDGPKGRMEGYLEDNVVVGPFTTPDGGRKMK